MRSRIFLFDMDDVLLQPGGYQQALIETVGRIGRTLGFQEVRLTPKDIAYFEAAGSTSEWDTAAICAVLLLKRVWARHPEARLPAEPDASAAPNHGLEPPDLRAFARTLARSGPQDAPPRARAERLLTADKSSLTKDQRRTLQAVLQDARNFERSVTFQLFQELVLGSQAYSEAYQVSPSLHVEGTLRRFDRPTLNLESYRRLQSWLDHPNHAAAIITNRPSMPPDGGHGTPEAESGAELAGLDHLPLVGLGALAWRSSRDGLARESYLKPSPVHALAGLQMALGATIEAALEAAATLDRGGQGSGWERLAGAQVWVFEDAAKGMRSALGARQALAGQGIEMDLSLLGITKSPPKRAALLAEGAQIFPDLNAALAGLLD